VVVATDWPQFLGLDLVRLRGEARGDLFFDGRNDFDPVAVERAGFRYVGIGRSARLDADGRADDGSEVAVASDVAVAPDVTG
jgi:hypothetical protein